MYKDRSVERISLPDLYEVKSVSDAAGGVGARLVMIEKIEKGGSKDPIGYYL